MYISLITALVTLLITYQSQLLLLDDDNEVVEEWSRERRKVESSFAKTGKHKEAQWTPCRFLVLTRVRKPGLFLKPTFS